MKILIKTFDFYTPGWRNLSEKDLIRSKWATSHLKRRPIIFHCIKASLFCLSMLVSMLAFTSRAETVACDDLFRDGESAKANASLAQLKARALKNHWLVMMPRERIAQANLIHGGPLTQTQATAVFKARRVGLGSPSIDSGKRTSITLSLRKITQAVKDSVEVKFTSEFSQAEMERKAQLLRDSWFTVAEQQAFLDSDIVGGSKDRLFPLSIGEAKALEGKLVKLGYKFKIIVALISNHPDLAREMLFFPREYDRFLRPITLFRGFDIPTEKFVADADGNYSGNIFFSPNRRTALTYAVQSYLSDGRSDSPSRTEYRTVIQAQIPSILLNWQDKIGNVVFTERITVPDEWNFILRIGSLGLRGQSVDEITDGDITWSDYPGKVNAL